MDDDGPAVDRATATAAADTPRPPTPEAIGAAELLTRHFSWRDWQEGRISSGVFVTEHLSVFRDSYVPVDELLAELPAHGAAQVTAEFVLADGALELKKDDPPQGLEPYGHVTVQRPDESKIKRGQAKRLRDAAMKRIVRHARPE
jgi:hypothetical protein